MNKVTDPDIINQLEGNQNIDSPRKVVDPDILNQLNSSDNDNTNNKNDNDLKDQITPTSVAENIGVGALDSMKNLAENFTSNKSVKNFDPYKTMGVKESDHWYTPSGLEQGFGHYAPYALTGTEQAVGKGLSYLPKIGSALEKSPLASWIARNAGTGAIFGATQNPESRGTGAIEGTIGQLLGGAVGHAIPSILGTIFGTSNTINRFGNMALKHLRKQPEGSVSSPEEVSKTVSDKYTDEQGNQVPVDVGTATKSHSLSKIFEAIKKVPFSGGTQSANRATSFASTKEIGKSENALTSALDDQSIQQSTNLSVRDDINSKIRNVENNESQVNELINRAPEHLDSLTESVPNPSEIEKFHKDQVRSVFTKNMQESNKNYEPLNKNETRLDLIAKSDEFKSYRSAAVDLLTNRENIKHIYGTDKDFGRKLNSELDIAEHFMGKSKLNPMPLNDTLQRIRSLGELASKAKSEGNNNESRLLWKLFHALKNDTDSVLRNNGYSETANQIQKANQYHEENIIPFYRNKTIRKAATYEDHIPSGSKLASALHERNNQSILHQLQPDVKKSMLFQLVSSNGKTSSGKTNLTPKQISDNYRRNVKDKSAIATYAPKTDEYFERLSQAIEYQKNLSKEKERLIKNRDEPVFPENKDIPKLERNLEKTKEQNKPSNYDLTPSDKGMMLAIAGGGAASLYTNPLTSIPTLLSGILASRTIRKSLTNPALLKAYTDGTDLPIDDKYFMATLSKLLTKAAVTGQFTGQGR